MKIRTSIVGLTIAFLFVLGANGCFSQYPMTDGAKVTGPVIITVTETTFSTPIPTASPKPTNSPVPSITGKIAFLNTAGNLYVADFKCSELETECDTKIKVLASNIDNLRTPSWSRDGKQIVVAPYRFLSPPGQVLIIDVDNGTQEILVSQSNGIHQPVWSPTDDTVAFVHVDLEGNGDDGGIRIVRSDGGEPAILLRTIAFISELAWSPDGRYLAFEHLFVRGGYQYLYVLPVNADELFEQEKGVALFDSSVTSNLSWGHHPTWSPDGKQIAFVCSGNRADICLLDLETWEQTDLINDPALDDQPTWSPDGRQIAFISDRDGNREIYLVNVNGSNETRLTNTLSDELLPSWSPDGNYIIFMSNQDDIDFECDIRSSFASTVSYYIDSSCNYEIYIMKADGTHQWRLTNNNTCDIYPAWAPQ
jgi:TolB protein